MFFRELQRRNVLRAGAFNAAAVWALAQGVSQLKRALRVARFANFNHGEVMEKEKTFALIRMETFSDGVLAVIITIMALELKVPEIVGKFQPDVLVHLLPKLASYAIAFTFVGLSWIHHLLALRDVQRATLKLIWINLLFLFCASLIPFTTAFLGDHPTTPLAVAMWGSVAGLTAFTVHLVYNEAHTDRTYEQWSRRQNACSVAAAIACVATSFLSVYLAWFLLFTGFAISTIPSPLARRIFSRERDFAN